MNGPHDATPESVRDDLLVTVASLYYEHNQNQQQIAERLDVSRSSVSRMIKEARDRGIVEIHIHKPAYRDFDLEYALVERFGLRDARVLRGYEMQSDGERLQAVGRLAAGYLDRVLEMLPDHACIGIAWGTGAYAAVASLSEHRHKCIDVVQIIGSVGAPNPLIDGPDLARVLAGKLGGRHYYLHAPVLVEQPSLRDMLYQEPTVSEGLRRASRVALAITGVGTMEAEASSFLRTGHLTEEELVALRAEGIVGETCGRFFDAQGRCDGYAINQRVVGIELDELRDVPRVIAVALGLPKALSILGALRGRYLKVLATDDVTARAVLDLDQKTDRTRI